MTREDVRKAFPTATEEQVTALLNIHSADIGKAKAQAGADAERLRALEGELNSAKQAQAELAKAKQDAQALFEQVKRYQEADSEREKAQAEARAREELDARFNAVVGERKFVHEYVRQGVKAEFESALATQQGDKSDAELFAAITSDAGCFLSMNPDAPNMGDIGAAGGADANARAVMGLPLTC